MKPSEAILVLAKIQTYDRRTVGRGDEMAWAEALEHIDYQDALDAIKAYHQSGETGWMMPGHIIRLVAANREQRRNLLHAAGPPDFPNGLSYAEEQKYRRVFQLHVGNGMSRDEATALADRDAGVTRQIEPARQPDAVRDALEEYARRPRRFRRPPEFNEAPDVALTTNAPEAEAS